jgi:L-ascorbate metabolism protein UlaG (beta-lactamase superfamily)
MKVKWLGHSCFLITAEDGLRVITDPYNVGGGINYAPIDEAADIVVVSHDHYDHNNISAIRGKPEVAKGSGVKIVRGVEFRGIATYHDNSQGKQRGPNTVFCFTIDDIRLCHLGDLGHLLNQKQLAEIGEVDVLLIPVGGVFTIGASEAAEVCHQLNPRLIFPMHLKTAKCDYPISSVDDFIKDKERIRKLHSSEVEFRKADLPNSALSEIVVLQPAL